MDGKQMGAIWIGLALALLWGMQLTLGQETTAAVVATALAAAKILRDAWAVVNEPPEVSTRSTGPQKSKLTRWMMGE